MSNKENVDSNIINKSNFKDYRTSNQELLEVAMHKMYSQKKSTPDRKNALGLAKMPKGY